MSSMLDLPPPGTTALAEPPAERARLRAVPPLDTPPLDTPPLDFDDVVRRLTPRLQRYAMRRLGDRHEAEELVQEALLRAFHHRDELRTEDDVAAWSTCVTGRLVIDRLRVRGRTTSVAEVPEGRRTGRDTADVVVARDEARLALDALDAMQPRQAAVLWAREVEGLSYDDIAIRFAMTEPAVRSVLSRARKALRKEFATRGGTLPAGGLVALAPWLDGLTWLDRLRRVAVRAAAPAALGVVSLGVLGGAVLSPWDDGPVRITPQTAVALPAHEVASHAETLPPPVAETASEALPEPPAAAAPAPATLLDTAGVSETCVDAGGATAGGIACARQRDDVLHLGPPLPSNPTGVSRVGVESSALDCRQLPTLPLTECTPGENR